uniref:Uncharacterized protein n=1 Tax=Tanacetum cinerariifolium TaxID=118510 RepID=A0A6L2KKW1_TANCI|nr:hypothetical protein [Tanacetum cinerariifolium]
MESLSPQAVSAAKLPILNPNEFNLWKMRIEQYFLMTDYSLWEVILNGDSPVPTRVIEGVVQPVAPTITEQRLARKNELKALARKKRFGGNKETKKVQKTLLKQQYENFTVSSFKSLDQIQDRLQKLISQLEILGESLSQEDINLKFLRSLPTEWRTHTLIWRNKTDLEEQSLDDLFNSLKIYEAEVKSSSSASTSTQNISFVSSQNADSTNEPVSAVASVSAASAKIPVSALPNVDTLKQGDFFRGHEGILDQMDLLQWGLICKRWSGTTATGNGTLQKSAGHLRTQGGMFNFQAEEEPTNYAFMAFTSSSSSSSDNEVASCSKACTKAYATLQSHYDKLTNDLRKSQFDVISYKAILESVEARLLVYQQNETIFEEDIKLLKLDVQLRDNTLVVLRQKFKKAEQERDELKLKLEKFQTSSKNLSQLLASQTNDKTRLGYNNQVFTSFMFDCNEMFSSATDESLPANPIYDMYQSREGYHAIPPPYTETFMPPKLDLVFHDAPNVNETIHIAFNVELSPTKPDKDFFVQQSEQVKTPRPSVKPVENSIPAAKHKITILKLNTHGNNRNRKACFHYARMTLPNPQRHVVPTAVLTKSKLVLLTAARPVTTAVSQPLVTRPRPAKTVITKLYSPPRRTINRRPSPPASNFPIKVTTAKAPKGNPQHALKDKEVIDSGCSRHMTGNMSYLFDFEEINGGYVAFGGNPNGGKITSKGKIRTSKLDFNDVYFVKELKFNLFSVSQMCDKKNGVLFIDTEYIVLSPEFKLPDENQVLLRNVVPSGDLTCLFAKETLDESNLWHRRLGHINFKTMNKLVKGKGDDNVQQYVLFPLWSSGSKDSRNTNGDATFDVKEPEFEVEKPESDVHVSQAVNAASILVPAVGQFSTNSTNTFSVVGPSNTAVSPTHGKSSYVDTSQYPDDPNMTALEDITYSDDDEDVGAEADFTNLEKTITVSPIPTTRVHKDHPMTQIIGGGIDYEEVFAPVVRIKSIRLFLAYASFMGFMVNRMDVKSAFLYGTIDEEKPDGIFISHDKYVAGILRKFDLTDEKSTSTPTYTEKPLLKDPDGEDVDVHTYRSMIGSLMYLTSSRPDIMFARTSWNEFSSSMASAVICLSTGRKINFSKYIFDSLVRNVDSSSKFYMYPRFLQLMIKTQVGNLSSYTTKYSSSALTQKVFSNMRRVGKGFYEVETPLFKGMIVAQQADDVADEGDAGVDVDDVHVAAAEPSIPSPTPTTQPPPPQELPSTSQVIPTPPPSPIAQPSSPPQQQQPSQPTYDVEISLDLLHTLLETCTTLTKKVEALEQDKLAQALEIIMLKQRVKKLEKKNKLKVSGLKRLKKVKTTQRIESSADTVMDDQEDASKQGRIIELIDSDKDVSLENVEDDELEPAELKKIVEVVTTAKLMTEVVTAAAASITAATTPITAATITVAPSATRRRKRVVIRDPEETATPSIIIHTEPKSKDKGKEIMVQEPKPLKKQARIEQDKAYARELKAELNKNIN